MLYYLADHLGTARANRASGFGAEHGYAVSHRCSRAKLIKIVVFLISRQLSARLVVLVRGLVRCAHLKVVADLQRVFGVLPAVESTLGQSLLPEEKLGYVGF